MATSRSMTPDRFYEQTERVGDCLIWVGKSRIGNYGSVGYKRKKWLAHRLSYFFATGENPAGMVVRHGCDTPLCVEPTHLELGTHQDNINDKVGRRRHRFRDSHPMSKLSSADVAEIRRRHAAGDVMQKDLAEEFGVSRQQLSKIIKGDQWKGD